MITPLGLILLPLGVVLFFLGRRYLFWAVIASLPFFYTVVLILPFEVVRPFQFFGLLLIARQFVTIGLQGVPRVRLSVLAGLSLLFLGVLCLSLVMPVLIEGRVNVTPTSISFREYEATVPLRFSSSNLTQLIFPTFSVMLFLSLLAEMQIRPMRLLRVLKTSVLLVVPIIVSGLIYQVGLLVLGQAFISRWFNFFTGSVDISSVINRTAYRQTLGNFPRMFSLAGEPGFTALYLLFVFALLLVLSFSKFNLFHSSLQWCLLAATFLSIMVTGSTTGYAGLAVLLLAFLFIRILPSRGSSSGTRLLSVLVSVVSVSLLLTVAAMLAPRLIGFSLVDYLSEDHLTKVAGEEGSGVTRYGTAEYGLEVFLSSPLLGVGYGSHRTTSLLITLLSNTGILGVLAFLLWHGYVLYRGLFVYQNSHNPLLTELTVGLLVALVTLLPLVTLGKSTVVFNFGWYWFVLIMLEAAYCVYKAQQTAPVAQNETRLPRLVRARL
jgi:hypothetical protein